MLKIVLVCLVLVPRLLWAQAAGTPDGFATGATGAGSTAEVVTPASLAELEHALCSSFDGSRCTDGQARVVVLDHTFDFTGSVLVDGAATTTATGCVASTCQGSPPHRSQRALDVAGFCQGRTAAEVVVDNAGRRPLQIGSNKTVVGRGGDAGIRGRGLRIGDGNHNVIVQNLRLTDINAGVVWGGDALTLDDADSVWVDHNLFARIGRQMVVTGFGSATHVTLSHNEFDGRTTESSTCDNRHYWLWLFLGAHDTITVARNYVHDTSGRGPHAGGLKNAAVAAHLVNNYFENIGGEGAAMPLTDTATLLLEGNYFDHVSAPVYRYPHPPGPGYAFAPFVGQADSRNDLCRQAIGRDCVPNDQIAGGTGYQPLDAAAIGAFAAMRESLAQPRSLGETVLSVRAEAGVGVVAAGDGTRQRAAGSMPLLRRTSAASGAASAARKAWAASGWAGRAATAPM